ncbi:MAG: glycosyltransferase [Actinomycetota bacterium]
MLCCDTPALGGHVSGWLLVSGWAHAPGGVAEVRVSVDGAAQQGVEANLPRPDVHHEHGVPPDAGFRARLDTRGWGEGEHELSLEAVSRDGSSARVQGPLTVSEHGAYRDWLERRGESPGRVTLPFGRGRVVRADGSDLVPDLRRLARRGRGHLLVLDAAGRPARGARERVARAFRADPRPDLVYADEDAIVEDGGRGADFLKPAWSPELLLSTDYVGPLLGVGPAAAAAALDAAPGPIGGIYELCLALADAPLRVERVPEVLFTCERPRIARDDDEARAAIEALGQRRGLRARIEPAEVPGARHVGWEIRGRPRVSVVIPTGASGGLIAGCLESIVRKTTYPEVEVVLVDSSGGALDRHLSPLEGVEHRVVRYQRGPERFNFPRALRLGVEAAGGEYLLFCDDDTEVLTPEWVERMLEHAQLDGVGAVGAKLLFPDGDVQHGGVNVARGARGAYNLFAHLPGEEPGYRGLLGLARNTSAVTSACMMAPAELFRSLGGLDEDYTNDYCDPDFCHRAIEAGLRVVWTPRAVLVHREKQSREVQLDPADLRLYEQLWGERFAGGDDLYHPGFADYPSYRYAEPFPPHNVAVAGPAAHA